ncbi:hypothetical protein M9Y10_003409 [Tritrichomonas musculus]|uniref:Ankyrin repeat protein n=1 Tax=Tritrichomonas musculus TaxID=1915356 RepID=A0ABR2JPR9_9EUKA
MAVKKGNVEIVQLLLSCQKLDVKIPSSIRERVTDTEGIYEFDEAEQKDKNALALAEMQNNSQLIQVLKDHFQ